MRPVELNLQLRLAHGREVECARFLRGELAPELWSLLVALAAEVVSLHEAATSGARVVVARREDLDRLLPP